MREIISLHFGQAGVQTGSSAWELFCLEHNISPDGTLLKKGSDGVSTFFSESSAGKYVPRCLMVDLEQSVISEVMHSEYGNLFHPEMMIMGKEDAANNFARGHYTAGKEVSAKVVDGIRKISEACDCLQGFIIYHSVGGGTGSGLTAGICEILQEDRKKEPVFNFSTWPSPRIATSVVEPYNAIMSIKSLVEHSSISVVLDNEAIYRICQDNLKFHHPNYKNLNQLISQVISSVTASLRCCGELNMDINEFQTNLVPFPRLHFMLSSYSPILSERAALHENLSVSDITLNAFDQNSMMCHSDPSEGVYMSCCLMYRGDVTSNEVSKAVHRVRERNSVKFVSWIPTGFKTSISADPPATVPNSAMAPVRRAVSMISNNTSINSVFKRLARGFDIMFSRRAFVHWFVGEGMEESEFSDARDCVAVLERDYYEIEGDCDLSDSMI